MHGVRWLSHREPICVQLGRWREQSFRRGEGDSELASRSCSVPDEGSNLMHMRMICNSMLRFRRALAALVDECRSSGGKS